jgi:protein O-mannosyl-transferase
MKKERSVDEAAQPTQGLSNRALIYLLFAISAISLWIFRPVLANGFVNWDDQIYLAELARMGKFSWSSLRWMWTSLQPFYLQPIAWMTHLADYQLWGMNAIGHHATNWVLHGIYVALVGTLVWLLTGTAGNVRTPERLAMSTGIALVCGIHPLQVESVAWVAARNGLLCSVWMVAALCAYVRAVGSGGEPERPWWWTTIALQAVALLTKPFAVSLPLVMLAVDFFPLRRHANHSWWRLLAEKWLMIALCGAAAVGAVAAQEHLEGLGEYTLGARALAASRGVVFYLWKLIWPAWLSPFYPLTGQISLRSEEFLVPLLFCVVVTAVAVWQRNRLPAVAAAWWSYLAVLGPVLGLVQVGGQAVADRYAYLAMVPALIALGSVILWLWHRGSVLFKTVLYVVLGLWFVFLGLSTRKQIAVWRDDLSLWGAVLSHFPNDPLANYNAALPLLETGHLVEARVVAERAVNYSDPHTPQLPMARAMLGAIYLKSHAYDLAVEQLQQAVHADGTLWAARYNLACSYARLGRLPEAYDELHGVIVAQPEYATLAARDSELRSLRDDPAYGARLNALIRGEGR